MCASGFDMCRVDYFTAYLQLAYVAPSSTRTFSAAIRRTESRFVSFDLLR